jgi:hypothetical protein
MVGKALTSKKESLPTACSVSICTFVLVKLVKLVGKGANIRMFAPRSGGKKVVADHLNSREKASAFVLSY